MLLSRRFLLGVLVVGLACSEESAPAVPTAMVLAGGNSQSGLPGVTLALPLRVTVTGTGGAAFPGARVTWLVATGSASLGSPTDTTDVNGEASTTVTVGVVPGNLVVTATVTGVPAVTFSLTALNPCTALVNLSTDTTANAFLTNFDCQFNGPFFTDFYSFVLPAQAGLRIVMDAVYDTYLEQYFTNDAFIAVNDDVDSLPDSTDSHINVIAAAGTYKLAASTFLGNVTGAYSLTIGPRAQTLAGCRTDFQLPWITRGVAIADQVEATDCTTIRPGGGRAYGDRVFITLTPARALSMTLASAAFNPRVELYELVQPAGQPPTMVFRTSADGSGGSATLTYTPTAGALFRLEFTSMDTVQTGAYTLTVTGPIPGTADVIDLPPGATIPAARARLAKARPN